MSESIVGRLERNVALGRPRQLVWVAAESPDIVMEPQQFLAGVRRLAGFLGQRIMPRAVLPILIEPGPNQWLAFYGAIAADIVPSIFATPNIKTHWETYARDLAALLRRYRSRVILVEQGIREKLSAVLAGCGGEALEVVAIEAANDAKEADPRRVDPAVVAFLQHSSGSTGIKKGVALTHDRVLRQVDDYARAVDIRSDDQIVSWLPLYHDMGLIACCLTPCLTGVSVASLSPQEWVVRPESLLEVVTRRRGTHIWLPNFAFPFLARRVRPESVLGLDLSSLRAIVNCSEPVLAPSMDVFLATYRGHGVRPEALSSSYGMAENVFAVTQTPPGRPPMRLRARPDSLAVGNVVRDDPRGIEVVSSGVITDSARVRICDPWSGALLPMRTVGELEVTGPCIFQEYHANEEATRDAFRDGWFRTGDVGFMAGDEVFVLGRIKDLIIVGGRNFYPSDLESAANEVPGVKQGRVVAFGVLDEEKGTEGVVVLVESDDHADAKASNRIERGVKASCVQRVDCVVERVVVLAPGELVKTSSGKIARAENRRLYLERHGKRG